MRKVLCLLLCVFAVLPAAAAPADGLQSFLDATVKAQRDKAHLPAMAALVQIDGRIVAETALGERALGHSEQVTTNDLWHLGSDTKAFTSMVIARLVERGVMKFEDKLADIFPSATLNPAYRDVTIVQLLTHTAGLPPLTDDKDLAPYMAAIVGATDIKEQRARLVAFYLAQAPATPPGKEFHYSNLGYIFAGAAAERRTGKAWEDLVRAEIFAPLGITHAGFGLPGSDAKVDQPRGHKEIEGGKLEALAPSSPDADNPPSLGPAGAIHISLHDWALFAQDQLDGVHGHGKLLKPETYRRLYTTLPASGPYALGWGVKLGPDGVPLLLTHSGSNGYWLADIRILPKHDIIILTVSNAGTENAEAAVKDVVKALIDRLHPFD